MRPRTKYEKEMAAINATLHEDIALKDMEWAKAHSYQGDDDNSNYYYFDITERHKSVPVRRLYRIYRTRNRRNKKDPYNYIFVEIQRMIGGLVFAKQRGMCFHSYDTFSYGSEIELRRDCEDRYGYTLKALYELSEGTRTRGGRRVSCCTCNPNDLSRFINSCPMAETMYNSDDFLVGYLVGRPHLKDICNSIRIARRHRYDINKGNACKWIDTLEMLRGAGRDINSPHYICPQNLDAAHALALRWYNNEMERQRAAREIAEAAKRVDENERYIREKERFFNLLITDGTIECHVLKSVNEFAEEGAYMHHCVYACGYYRKPNSVIFSARINGERIETVEVDLETMKVVQCYGKYDKHTEYHNTILSLFRKNMYQIESVYRKSA